MKRILASLLTCALTVSLLSGCSNSPVLSGSGANELSAGDSITPIMQQESAAVNGVLPSFGLTLLKNTRTAEQRPVLLSPLSVALALSMAANGADGDTLAQFEAVLADSATLDELNAACAQFIADYQELGGSTKCAIANSIWCDPEGQVREDFIGKCQGVFHAQVFQAQLSDPAIVESLNGWVSKHTNQMIPAIIGAPFPEGTAALLVNALYLKNTWTWEFDPQDTREHPFSHGSGQTERMDFLNQHEQSFPYIQGDGVQGVVLPYDDGRLAFTALMPDGDLDPWLDGLEGDDLVQLVEDAEDTRFLRLGLPKFEAEWNGSLTDILAGMGLDAAFDPARAGFSRLGENPDGYFISQVIHAVKIEVNEKGTEAAAATVVAAPEGAMPPPPDGIRLVLDRPFLYGIVDLETGVPLFLGTFE